MKGYSPNNELELLGDATLILLSTMWFGFLGFVGYSCIKTYVKSRTKARKKIKQPNLEKEVIILRGVPGVGKHTFVLNNEINKDGGFSQVSTDDFFYNDNGEFVFDRKNIDKSNAYCLDKFHTYLQFQVPRIYISNVNQKKWMYINYINIAKSYGYKVKVIELVCYSSDYLSYFNSRSNHNVPMSYSRKVYDEWEDDENSIIYEPFLGDEVKGHLTGDCIPFPKKTIEQLDQELLEYMKNGRDCSIADESENDCSITSESDEEEDDEIKQKLGEYVINYVDLDTKNEILKRNIKISRDIKVTLSEQSKNVENIFLIEQGNEIVDRMSIPEGFHKDVQFK